jgi:hypothetical protein
MEKKEKQKARIGEAAKGPQGNEVFQGEKPKSKTTLFWEKYPNGVLRILDKKAVLE